VPGFFSFKARICESILFQSRESVLLLPKLSESQPRRLKA